MAEVAPIYRALSAPRYENIGPPGHPVLIETRRGFTPPEVDDMELWVIADLLGINDPDAVQGGSAVTEDEFRRRSADLNAERIRRAKEGLPPPEAPRSATPEVTDDMIAALAQRRREREAQRQGA